MKHTARPPKKIRAKLSPELLAKVLAARREMSRAWRLAISGTPVQENSLPGQIRLLLMRHLEREKVKSHAEALERRKKFRVLTGSTKKRMAPTRASSPRRSR